MQIEKLIRATDRRKKRRFPISRELRYKLLADGVIVGFGTGQTLNMGSAGIAFSVDRGLRPGAFIELSISWPVLLDNACPMRLIVFGVVRRNEGGRAVCTIDKYEFRTQARTFQAAGAMRHDSMLQRWAVEMLKDSPKPPGANA